MEFEIDGRSLRAEKLSAFKQLHLSRKVAPLLPALAPVLVKYAELGKEGLLSTKILQIAELAQPFTDALAQMRNEDAEEVMTLALSTVKVQTDESRNVWMPLWNSAASMATVSEFNDLGKLLPIVVKVIVFNLGNFIDGLLSRHENDSPESNGGPSLVKKTG